VDAFANKLEQLYKDASLRARLSAGGVYEAGFRSWDEVFGGLRASVEEAIGSLIVTL
jgi:hypothetical protein